MGLGDLGLRKEYIELGHSFFPQILAECLHHISTLDMYGRVPKMVKQSLEVGEQPGRNGQEEHQNRNPSKPRKHRFKKEQAGTGGGLGS